MDKVSQYRLAAHLALATVILGATLWVAFGIRRDQPARSGATAASPCAVFSAFGLTALIFLQIVLGAFVSGLHAGLSHNTWPLMDGHFIPEGLDAMSPWWVNLFENVMTVQFDHRMAAYAVAAWAWGAAAWLWIRGQHAGAGLRHVACPGRAGPVRARRMDAAGRRAPSLALTHQAGALIVFALAVWRWRRISLPAAL